MNFAASLAVLAVLNVTSPLASAEAVSSTWAQHARREPTAPVPQLTHPKCLGRGGSAPVTRTRRGASAAESRAGGGEVLRGRGLVTLAGRRGAQG